MAVTLPHLVRFNDGSIRSAHWDEDLLFHSSVIVSSSHFEARVLGASLLQEIFVIFSLLYDLYVIKVALAAFHSDRVATHMRMVLVCAFAHYLKF